MPEVPILMFGPAREATNSKVVRIEVPQRTTLFNLKNIIFDSIPSINHLKESCLLAINQEFVETNETLIDVDDCKEIAVIPPLAGG